MLPRYAGYLVAATLACACAPSGASRTATLATLQHEIAQVRRGEAEAIQNLPPVESLVGAHHNQLRAALGSPQLCEIPLEDPCERVGEVIWIMHAAGSAGPILVVREQGDHVVEARWRRPEIAGPPSRDHRPSRPQVTADR